MSTFLQRIAAAAVLVLLALAPPAGAPASAAETKLTVVVVNDIDRIDGMRNRGGFARLGAIVKAERAKGGHVLYVHAGDTISPSLMSGFDKGAHVIELLNLMPPDVFVPGNHEFDFGPDVFRQRMAELKVPMKLAANLRDETGQPLAGFEDRGVIELDGVRIGIVGIAADDSPVKSSPGKLQFADGLRTALTEARALRRDGVDFVVLVAHARRAQDEALFQTGAFDLILSGDDHDLAVLFNGRTALVESKEQGEFVTAIDLTLRTEERDGRRQTQWWPNFRIIDSATVAPDDAVEAKAEEYRKQLSRELDVELGRIETGLDSRRATVRTGEAAIGNLVADAMRWATGADVAITNGGGIRGNRLYALGAPFSRRDVLTELPFGNKTVLIEIGGETLLAALEHGVGQIEEEAGRFPQVSGLAFEYDRAKPAGSRILSVRVGAEPLEPKKTYRLALNDFMLGGGDGYRMFARARQLLGERDAKLLANDVMAYLRERGRIDSKIEGRIVAR